MLDEVVRVQWAAGAPKLAALRLSARGSFWKSNSMVETPLSGLIETGSARTCPGEEFTDAPESLTAPGAAVWVAEGDAVEVNEGVVVRVELGEGVGVPVDVAGGVIVCVGEGDEVRVAVALGVVVRLGTGVGVRVAVRDGVWVEVPVRVRVMVGVELDPGTG